MTLQPNVILIESLKRPATLKCAHYPGQTFVFEQINGFRPITVQCGPAPGHGLLFTAIVILIVAGVAYAARRAFLAL